MHIITRKRLNDNIEIHPEARSSLLHWYQWMKSQVYASFDDLQTVFPHVD